MFGVLPIERQYYNMSTQIFFTTEPPTALLLWGGKNTWKGVKHQLYYGLTNDGHFVVYVPATVDVEAFATENSLKLDWCAFESINQPYFNLGVENSLIINNVHAQGGNTNA